MALQYLINHFSVCNTCTPLSNHEKYVDANSDDNAISGNAPKNWNEPKQVMPMSENLSRSLEICGVSLTFSLWLMFILFLLY